MPDFYIILARKLAKYPNFIIFFRRINKIPEFYMIFARKMPEFYIIIARKIFFPNFRGARARLLRLWVRLISRGIIFQEFHPI